MRTISSMVLVILVTPTALALPGGCTDAAGVAYACAFAGADPYMTGAIADVYFADGTSVGAGVFRVEGFFGPAIVADVHGTTSEGGWHAGAGASDYDFDNVPDSTRACVGVWSWQTGYIASAGVGTFDTDGDGPSADDTFAYAGAWQVAGGVGVIYGWNENAEPYVELVLP